LFLEEGNDFTTFLDTAFASIKTTFDLLAAFASGWAFPLATTGGVGRTFALVFDEGFAATVAGARTGAFAAEVLAERADALDDLPFGGFFIEPLATEIVAPFAWRF
jgi:hypothetical protein